MSKTSKKTDEVDEFFEIPYLKGATNESHLLGLGVCSTSNILTKTECESGSCLGKPG